MNTKTYELLNPFVVAFDAAPGMYLWSQVRYLADRPSGLSSLELVSLITSTPQFQALYPPSSTTAGSVSMDKVFSDALIMRVLGSAPVSDTARTQALATGIAIMAEAEKAGQGEGARRATLINTLAEYLGSIEIDSAQQGYDSTHPYLSVARQLANKVLVADYFTNVLNRDSPDIRVLRDALSRVNDKSLVLGVDGSINESVAKTLISGFDSEVQLKLYQGFIVALDAAPGGYWNALKALVETEGQGPAQITSIITGTPQFQACIHLPVRLLVLQVWTKFSQTR